MHTKKDNSRTNSCYLYHKIPKRKGTYIIIPQNFKKERGIYMFSEKIKCVFCLEEKPEDEVIEGICLDCLTDHYTPERAIQFIADTGREKEFYVETYMDGSCSEANTRLVGLCKAEFHKGIQLIKFQMKNCTPIDEYLEDNTFEYGLLKDYVLNENMEDWAWWFFGEEQKKAGNVIVLTPAPHRRRYYKMRVLLTTLFISLTCESMVNILGTLGFLVFASAALLLSGVAEKKRKVGLKCHRSMSNRYAHN